MSDDNLEDLDVLLTPFNKTRHITVPFRPRQPKPLAFTYDTCPHLYGCKIVVPKTLRKLGKYTRPSTFDGAYILAVNGQNVFSVSDVTRALSQLARVDKPPAIFTFTFLESSACDYSLTSVSSYLLSISSF